MLTRRLGLQLARAPYARALATKSSNKIVASAEEAIADIQSNMTLCVGGFGLCGIPENLIGALVKRRLLDAESNFCYGEGGAGTWSDGKLTTRIGRNPGGRSCTGNG